jgi:hypothetical protein
MSTTYARGSRYGGGSRTRRIATCPVWLAKLLTCRDCKGRLHCTPSGYATCWHPWHTGLITKPTVAEIVEKGWMKANGKSPRWTTGKARRKAMNGAIRLAWRYLRGRIQVAAEAVPSGVK